MPLTISSVPTCVSRGGRSARSAAKAPVMRRCCVSREVQPQEKLLRFVVAPEGDLTFDVRRRLPGRGLWLAPHAKLLEKSYTRKLFAKAARQAVTIPPNLSAHVVAGLEEACLQWLGLARGARLVTAGSDAVRTRLRKGGVGLLICAVDAAEGSRAKIETTVRQIDYTGPRLRLCARSRLGQALGMPPVAFVALAKGRLTQELHRDGMLLAAFSTKVHKEEDGDKERQKQKARRPLHRDQQQAQD